VLAAVIDGYLVIGDTPKSIADCLKTAQQHFWELFHTPFYTLEGS
jgi:hypothetical protein